MKKILILVLAVTTLFSCSKTEGLIFDGNRSITYFENSAATLEVIIDAESNIVSNTVSVNLVSTEISTTDRTYEIGLVRSTIDEASFTFPSSVTIPAGEYRGVFTVTGFLIDQLTTSNELLVFEILSASDNADLNGSLQEVEMQMRLVCELASTLYVGSYTITQIDPDPVGGADVAFSGEVILSTVEGRSTSRQFESTYLPDLGIGQPATNIIFDISCGEVIADDDLSTSLLCTQGEPTITFGQAIGDNFIIQDTGDDSQFTIIMQEGQSDGGCAGYPFDATFVLTKN